MVFAVLVLVCVPGFTRMGQRLETASRAPSIAKNIDCPPKKVTVTPAAVATPLPVAVFDHAPVARPSAVADAMVPRGRRFFGPRPLRAPPLALLA